jgi:RNA polymerase sigma-70 factor (ECF subfamily)
MVELRLDAELQRRLDPSDVLQESFLEASKRLEEYLRSKPMPLFNWLRFLTAQRLQKLRRFHCGAKGRDPRREVSYTQLPPVKSETLAQQAIARLPSPSDAAVRKEMKKRVQGVLDAMEPLDREILVLRHFEDLTSAEAARELGLREAAARQRYVRALLRFRRAFSTRKSLS